MKKFLQIIKYAFLSIVLLLVVAISVFFGNYYEKNPFAGLSPTKSVDCFSFTERVERVIEDEEMIESFVKKLKRYTCVRASEENFYGSKGTQNGWCSFIFGEQYFEMNGDGVCMVGGPLAPKYYRLLFFDTAFYARFVNAAEEKK